MINLDKEKVKIYQEKGVVFLPNIIDKYWLEKLNIGIQKNFSNPSKSKCIYEKNDNMELFYDDKLLCKLDTM